MAVVLEMLAPMEPSGPNVQPVMDSLAPFPFSPAEDCGL